MENNSSKIYPVSSDEVAEMLGLKLSLDAHTEPEKHAENPAEVLPVEANSPDSHAIPSDESPVKPELPSGLPVKAKTLVKSILPYFLVFIVGLVMYYFFFSN